MKNIVSRFAEEEEIFTGPFAAINDRLLEINREYNLIDHAGLNSQRFRWANRIAVRPGFYAARMWEYPFAVLAAELEPGMKCADIGCGTTPFTPYLGTVSGIENITGFDPDYFENEDKKSHYAFGITRSFIDKAGFNFQPDDMTQLNVPDGSFDRVFCLSVIEHITEPVIWQKGIKEMVRVLKPGGRLILTVDLGINCPLTNPLDIIKFSGLVPAGNIDFRWPQKRFVNMNGEGLDVFGIVLEKSVRKIFADYNGKNSIVEHEAYKNFIPPSFSLSQIQIGKDIKRQYGKLITISKLLSGKYK